MKKFTLAQVLEDLTSRFILNIPDVELNSIERVIFQVEQAHWFYEDFVRDVNTKLQSLSLKHFSSILFQSCALLNHIDHEIAFSTFMEYKVKVPVCGAIILNTDLSKVLLVRGWKSSSPWGFPKGKINQGEPETSCAIREVFEETGFDASNYFRPNEYLERCMSEQRVRLYMITGVDESVEFMTQTRKEIGDIQWHTISTVPGFTKEKIEEGMHSKNKKFKYYMVTPFVSAIRKWIDKFKLAKKKGTDREKAGLKFDGDEREVEQRDDGIDHLKDYNVGVVPLNQRIEMEDSLKKLLGLTAVPLIEYPAAEEEKESLLDLLVRGKTTRSETKVEEIEKVKANRKAKSQKKVVKKKEEFGAIKILKRPDPIPSPVAIEMSSVRLDLLLSPGGEQESVDVGLEMLLSGSGKTMKRQTSRGEDRGLERALSVVDDKQSLLNILKGNLPPASPSVTKEGSTSSFNANQSQVEDPVKQSPRILTRAQSDFKSHSSNQSSLLDILSGIPKPPLMNATISENEVSLPNGSVRPKGVDENKESLLQALFR